MSPSGKAAIRNSWPPSGRLRTCRAGCAGRSSCRSATVRFASSRACSHSLRLTCPSRSLIEALGEPGLVLLPLREQGGDLRLPVALAVGAERPELPEQAELLVLVDAFLEVAIFAPLRAQQSRARSLRRPGRGAVPGGRFTGQDLGAARLHDALAGAVVEQERLLRAPRADRAPRLATLAARSRFRLLLDPVAPPDARALRERREVLRAVERPAAAGELDIALRRRADARGGRVLDQPRDVQRAECEPASARDGDAEGQYPEPEVGRVNQTACPGPRRACCSSANSSSAEALKSNMRATTRSGKVWMRMLFRLTASL